MRKWGLAVAVAAITSAWMWGADWPMQNGNAQRNGWARAERLITKANIRSLQLLYKYRADNTSKGFNSLTPPIVNGNLITYRGFKEMLIFSGSSGKVFSVDADLNQLLWESRIDEQTSKPSAQTASVVCPGGSSSPVIMAGSSSSAIRFTALASRTPAAIGGVRPARPSPYFPPLEQSLSPLLPTTLTQLAALYTVSSEGSLHVVNSSTGKDLLPPFKFLPSNAQVTSLSVRDNVVYATTTNNCDGNLNALYAIDLLSSDKKVTSFAAKAGGFAGTGGTTIGNDGTIYLQTVSAPDDKAGKFHETIYALTPKTLNLKDYFTLPGKGLDKKALLSKGITPLVFSGKGKDMLLAGGRDGCLYLLDSTSLGGPDHHTPLLKTEMIATRSKNYDGNGFRGTFSSWQDVDANTRWIYVPLYGAPGKAAQFPGDPNATADGSVAAFKIVGSTMPARIEPAWIAQNTSSPASVVIANGMIFALSTGEPARVAQKNGKPYNVAEWQQMSGHAVLHVLDAITGKELYSSGDAVTDYSHNGGVSIANGRVYFATHNNTVYCFGFPREQPQLAEQQ